MAANNHRLTGYGPRYKGNAAFNAYPARAMASPDYASSRFQRLCFDGDAVSYTIWETKFLAFLLTKNAKIHEAITTTGTPDASYNKLAFAELVQVLDDKSLQLILNDAKDNGAKAIQILRSHNKSSDTTRIISLYTELTSLRMCDEEDITDYLIRAENIFTDLKSTGETLSENLLTAMILKGLPTSYETFVVVQTQADSLKSLSELKSSLITFTNSKMMRSSSSQETVMRASHTNRGPLQCFSCGKSNHRSKDCRSKANLTCSYCKAKGHVEGVCFKRKKDKNTGMSANTTTVTPNTGFSFVTSVHTSAAAAPGNRNRLLVDCGATCHILNNEEAFLSFDDSFDAKAHYVELADGNRSNDLLIARGTARVNLVDATGTVHQVTLENCLFAPSFPTSLFSVRLATQRGAKFVFAQHSSELLASDGTRFPILEERNLYFFDSVPEVSAHKTSTLYEWHCAMGHLNYDDLLKMPLVADGIKLADKQRRECTTCALNKQTHEPTGKKTELRQTAPLQLVYSDVCGPIDPPTCDGFRYIINFVDAYSSACFVYFLKTKDAADKALEQFIADVAPYGTILHLHTDNGGEYIGTQFKNILRERGIKHTTTAPYTPKQNGKAERNWRTLMDMARCLLHDSTLPKRYWMHAVRYAAFIRNRSYQRRTGKTAFELLTKQKPNIRCIYKFGSQCTFYDEAYKTKLDLRSSTGTFLGINPLNNAYIVLDSESDRIKSSRNVRFLSAPITNAEVPVQPDDESDGGECEHSNEPPKLEDNLRTLPRRERQEPKRYINEQTSTSVLMTYATKVLYEIPDTYREAVNSPESDQWERAMNEEIRALEENETWELVELPQDRTEIKGK